tara:strand:+ start:1917 stop:2441 length:525 start_codon:yes stop_codon:yes gene_type:complete
MIEHNLTIDFDMTTTFSDIANEPTLDVAVLKQDDIDAPVRAHVDEVEEEDERTGELNAIEAFIAVNGVTKPTEEDFKPKSMSWGGKSKAQKLAENPNYIERRGRKRSTFVKAFSFVLSAISPEGEMLDTFKRAGRGRAKKGETRLSFTVHHTNIELACTGEHTRQALIAMAKAS